MKKVLIYCFVLFVSAGFLIAKPGFYAGLGGHIPISSALHNEFEPGIPYVIPQFGIAFGIGDSWKICTDISYRSLSQKNSPSGSYFTIQSAKNNETGVEVVIVDGGVQPSPLDLALNIIPISVTANYYFSTAGTSVPFIGVGLADYTVFSVIHYNKIFENGLVAGKYSDLAFYNGLGLVANAGINFIFSKNSGLGISLRYDYTFIGTAKNGGLSDIGGIGLNVNYLFNFGGVK